MFRDIKDNLDNSQVKRILLAYDPRHTPESYIAKFQAQPLRSVYGWVTNGEVLGICGFEVLKEYILLTDLGVDESMRGRGIGSAMIDAMQDLFGLPINAETDDDAVEFYRKIGFDISEAPPKHGTRRWALWRDLSNSL